MVIVHTYHSNSKNNMRKYIKNSQTFDEYYTDPIIAKECIDIVNKLFPNIQLFIEPAAGNGSFSKQIKNCVAFDIKPKYKDIIELDFLSNCNLSDFDIKLKFNLIEQILCAIGNPPFGRCGSLAVKFFNKSATYCQYIAFILPKSFRKVSIQNRLFRQFHLILDKDIVKNAFIYNNKKHNVPCVFQIWEKRNYERILIELRKTSQLFDFVTNNVINKNNCDIALRRVGGNTGQLFTENINDLKVSSNYFIKLKQISLKEFKLIVNSIDFRNIINNTAGIRSLSKYELISLIESKFYGHTNDCNL